MIPANLIPEGALQLGLGCSRLGSVGGASPDEARALLHAALERGIRVFDTADIYAQGDSERLIAGVIGSRPDCVICSKAGKYLPRRHRALIPLKRALRPLVRRSERARARLAATRARTLPTRWDPGFLTDSLHGTLRRLRRERIELFLLHGPDAEILARGTAMDALAAAQTAGKIGLIGASVDDPAAAHAALSDPRLRVLQLPLRPGETRFDAALDAAAQAGVAVIAREILGGAGALAARPEAAGFAASRIARMIGDPRVALPLVGAVRLSTLDASARAAGGG